MYNKGMIIGLKQKVNRFKERVSKLLHKDKLNDEDKKFLEKEGAI